MKRFMSISLAAALCSASMGQAQAQTDLSTLHDELQIMSNIMQTALQQNNERKGIRFRSIEATYLANQGVVFDVSSAGSGFQFSFNFAEMLSDLDVPVAPEPPVHVGGDGNTWVIEFDEDWEQQVEEVAESAREAMRETKHRLRELREREREYSWEMREYERRRRDLEFEKRSADKESRERLEQRSTELEKELSKLKAKQAEVEKYAAQIEKEQEENARKQNEAKQQAYKRYLAKFEESVADVLCKYGAGLKALPDDENVSFVLSRLGDMNGATKQDKVYVFKHKDIKACVKDSINPNQLLTKAQTYLF
ncbi:hypothetical protein LJ739_17620 [Aestuariibacter halophilus]|uniref:Uncharacterized protein n=1 Tax=Fluctibacter halophilus TaxID=226011 RepID=A0ABS8GCG5_9ALTE|nr:hypothetical protein [Aestuariibacter halophilus]MCC2618078.1 hypothetical protein [Aestuariibacter halophilus]